MADGDVTCLACGMVDPPPEVTCDAGTPGITLRDHYVGIARGCQWCGRLPQACAERPCQEMTAMWRAIEKGGTGE